MAANLRELLLTALLAAVSLASCLDIERSDYLEPEDVDGPSGEVDADPPLCTDADPPTCADEQTRLVCLAEDLVTIPCPSGEACRDGACAAWQCEEGDAVCTGDLRMVCQQGFYEPAEDCGDAGLACDEGECVEPETCDEGARDCLFDSQPILCEAGRWVPTYPCLGPTTCDSGTCK